MTSSRLADIATIINTQNPDIVALQEVGSLNDYASRTWAGLLNDYYARRWEIYFDAVIGAAEKGIELDKDELKSRLATFEQEWVESTTPVCIERNGTLLDTSRRLLEKYGPRIEKSL